MTNDEKDKEQAEKTAINESPERPSEPTEEEKSLPSELEQLRSQLESKEVETKELQERLLRQAAELENFKKRMAREKEESIRYANEGLVKDLLPILDNLERAVEHAQGGGNGKPLLEGVELVLKDFLETLGKHGVTQISARGEKFDPEKHEAIAQVESEGHEPNAVVEEFHKGYYLLARLLRPALVSVAKSPESNEKKSEKEEVENEEGDD
jgi:molecular chaperone GrpE